MCFYHIYLSMYWQIRSIIRQFKTYVCPYPVLQQRFQVEGDVNPLYSVKLQRWRIWEKERAGHEEDTDQIFTDPFNHSLGYKWHRLRACSSGLIGLGWLRGLESWGWVTEPQAEHAQKFPRHSKRSSRRGQPSQQEMINQIFTNTAMIHWD